MHLTGIKENILTWQRDYTQAAASLTHIALPLIMASLVNMSISITDVIMIGWLGVTELAAGAIVSDYYSLIFYLYAGILAAISPLIAHARGAGQFNIIRDIVQQGFLLASLLAIPGVSLVFYADVVLGAIGISHQIVDTGAGYAHTMALTFIAMLALNVMHHFLAAHGKTKFILLVTACAMPINALGNYVFMFGHFGLEPMGLTGAGLSSFVSALFMFCAVMLYATRDRKFKRYYLLSRIVRVKTNHIREILHIGVPIGLTNLGMMGVFLVSTVIMGVFGTEALAAHTVTLRMAGVVFAVPMGFAQAATVRIGYAAGAKDSQLILQTTRTAIAICITAGLLILAGLTGFAADITRAFIGEDLTPQLLAQSMLFLTVLAIAQPFTNIACVGAGILRGFKDTRIPMLFSLIAYWGVSFLGGLSLAFLFDYGCLGIWLGLTAGSICYGLMIAYRLHERFVRQRRVFRKTSVKTADSNLSAAIENPNAA